MEIAQLFLQRYDALYGFWLGEMWKNILGYFRSEEHT